MGIRLRAAFGAVLVLLTVLVVVPLSAVATPATAVASGRTALQLPFKCGETWRGNGNASSRHVGTEIDFNWGAGSQDLGRPVLAAAGSVVQTAGNKGSGYGNYVQLRHPDGTFTLYAHMQRVTVKLDQQVAQGTQVGTVGGTSSRGAIDVHLHFEHKTSPKQQGFIRVAFDGKPFPYGRRDVYLKSNNCGGGKTQQPPSGAGHVALASLDGRLTPRPDDHAFKDLYAAGQPVPVVCKIRGVTGYADPTFALTADHVWVAGQYLAHAGTRGVDPSVRDCSVPLNARALDDLNSRKSKDMSDVDVPDRYRKAAPVPVVCTALGGPTGPGLFTWARTADKTWVPARYLHLALGKDGFARSLPRCDKDKAGQTGRPSSPGGQAGPRRDGATWTVSERGITFIAQAEGFQGGKHYNDQGGNCTVGYGHLVHRGPCTAAERAKPAISQPAAMRWLRDELTGTYRARTRQVVDRLQLSQNEYDALVSMVYNLGPGELLSYRGKPTEFITALRFGVHAYASIPARMENFSQESNKYSCGLNKRRQREGRIWALGDYDPNKITACSKR